MCFLLLFKFVLLQSNTNHQRKKSEEKNTKSYIVLKRPKISFLERQKCSTKKAPPLKSATFDLRGGAFLVGISLILEEPQHSNPKNYETKHGKKWENVEIDQKLRVAFLAKCGGCFDFAIY